MATVQLNITGHDQTSAATKSATGNIQSLDNSVDRLTSRVSSLAGALGLLYVGNKLWESFTLGIKAVDDFQQSVIKTSAMITSLQGGENIAENYRLAKEYAEGLQNTLMKVDANTSLNLDNLQSMTEEMIKQGIVLDTNNADQVEGFTRLANAAAMYSNNGSNEIQLRQEIRSLMMGQVDQNSQLASMVQQMVKGPLQEQVTKWKESGVLMQEMGKVLAGFGPASKDMAGTWSAVKSSLETSVRLIQRAGFEDIVKDIVGYVGKLNDYLKENKDMIGGKIKQGWEEFKSVAQTVAEVAKTIYNNFEPFAAIFIGGAMLKGIGSTVSLMKDLLAVATAARGVMLATGVITAGTAATAVAGTAAATGGAASLYGVGAAAAGSFLPGAIGASAGLLGAGAAGVGLGYAAQPLVRWADKKLYQGLGINLTGEAMYNEAEQKNQDADANWAAFKAKKTKYNTAGTSSPATPVVASKESDATYKARIDTQEKELAAYKAMQDSKTTIAKHAGDLELSELKQRYATGLISTQEYYDGETRISKDAAYEKYSNAVDYYNKEVDLLEQIGAKKGEASAEYQTELAKSTKADEAAHTAELEWQKVTVEGETKIQEQLRSRGQEYSKLIAQSQEDSGQYVEAAETRIAAEKKTVEYLQLEKDALTGLSGAAEALAAKQTSFAVQRQQEATKEADAALTRQNEISEMQHQVDIMNGKDQSLVEVGKAYSDGIAKAALLSRQLGEANTRNATQEIADYKEKIRLQGLQNQGKERQLQLAEEVAVLSGKIVGFDRSRITTDNPNGAVFANEYGSNLAATGYRSAAAALSASQQAVGTNYWGEAVNAAGNTIDPFGLNSISGARALGGDVSAYATYRINEDGTEYLTMGNKGGYITPAGKTPPGQSTTKAADIYSFTGDIILPNVTNQTTARELFAEFKKFANRQLP